MILVSLMSLRGGVGLPSFQKDLTPWPHISFYCAWLTLLTRDSSRVDLRKGRFAKCRNQHLFP
jgi:hypothetical protein